MKLLVENGHERVMATEPEVCVDILAGRFTYIDQNGVTHTADFYVRTCLLPDQYEAPGWEDAQSKREDDLNEQYTEVAMALMNEYGSVSVTYRALTPSPFF